MAIVSTAGIATTGARAASADRAVGRWLLALSGMVLVQVMLGAVTRLTDSGLSIMEWRPIMGAIPPLSDAEWHRVFDIYRQIAEYQIVNAGMSLDAFKTIFWWGISASALGPFDRRRLPAALPVVLGARAIARRQGAPGLRHLRPRRSAGCDGLAHGDEAASPTAPTSASTAWWRI